MVERMRSSDLGGRGLNSQDGIKEAGTPRAPTDYLATERMGGTKDGEIENDGFSPESLPSHGCCDGERPDGVWCSQREEREKSELGTSSTVNGSPYYNVIE